MFEIQSENIDLKKKNIIARKEISLDTDLDCFILISGDHESFIELALNNILDAIIDKIGTKNTYKEFSIALENINAFIKTWQLDGNGEIEFDMIIGILNKNTFLFSNVSEASCCLLKNDNEFIGLTSKKEAKKEFHFISSGELGDNEIVLLTNKRILDYLSSSDIVDGIDMQRNLETFQGNIKNILLEEIIEENIGFISIKYVSNTLEENTQNKPYEKIFEYAEKIKEIPLSKNIIKKCSGLTKKINKSSKNIKNTVFIAGILISLILIYQVISALVNVSTTNNTKQEAQTQLLEAKNSIRIASENIANQANFEANIENAQSLIEEIKEKKIFLNDISKINDDIAILKKQFNKIETMNDDAESALFQGDLSDAVKIINSNKKPFLIKEKGVLGPILPNVTPKNYVFNSLESTEVFVDAATIGSDIFLLTSFSKIVRFTQNGYFNYSDVIGQKNWQKSREIQSFGQNIYLVGKENSQIFRHVKNGTKFNAGNGYLTKEDLAQIGRITSIGIDGSFYILKEDLSMLKFYANPKYRLEKLVINKLPDNYDKQEGNIDLKSRGDLNYVYMLMNNKIWVFKPNSKDFRNTKSLTYIGQIEGNNSKIKDFFVNYDGEIYTLNEEGIYKVNFEISDDKLILR